MSRIILIKKHFHFFQIVQGQQPAGAQIVQPAVIYQGQQPPQDVQVPQQQYPNIAAHIVQAQQAVQNVAGVGDIGQSQAVGANVDPIQVIDAQLQQIQSSLVQQPMVNPNIDPSAATVANQPTQAQMVAGQVVDPNIAQSILAANVPGNVPSTTAQTTTVLQGNNPAAADLTFFGGYPTQPSASGSANMRSASGAGQTASGITIASKTSFRSFKQPPNTYKSVI